VNKLQTISTGTAILAALLIGPAKSLLPRPALNSVGAPPSSVIRHGNEVEGEGPWIASCQYWAPDRLKVIQPDKAERARQTSSGAAADAAGCSGGDNLSGWGIPGPKDAIKPEIHAIIASVPDPIHTHLQLEFDRTIDALLQAAAENGYIGSYFWLPWRSPGESGNSTAAAAVGTPDPARENQPGLIILKYVPDGDEAAAYPLAVSRVIYLFLIEQSPTLGTNGDQLQNAFLYESQLRARGASLSMKGSDELAIIGSDSSGAAASLREGIERAKQILPLPEIEVTGSTATGLASKLLTSQPKPPIYPLQPGSANNNPGIHYNSFAENMDFERDQLETLLSMSSYDKSRTAILIEDGTVFGEATAASSPKQQRPFIIRFPREISLLRNAHTKSNAGSEDQSSSEAPTPYLQMSLQDSSVDDSVPHFSIEQTPVSQEAQLIAIGRQLQRERPQFIAIVASDVLDRLFLAQFLHRACPNAQLVFFDSDLLLERGMNNAPFIGAVTLTPYGLTALTSSTPRSQNEPARSFADSISEAVFNAASYTFWDGASASRLKLAGYGSRFRSADAMLSAVMWATAIGRDGYYPLAIVNQCASDKEWILPEIQGGTLHPCDTAGEHAPPWTYQLVQSLKSPFARSSYSGQLPVFPALAWDALCMIVALLCVFHCLMLLTANYWSPFTHDLAVEQNDEPRRRTMYIYIGTAMLGSAAFAVAYPIFPTLKFFRHHRIDISISVITLLAGLAAVLVTVGKTWTHLWLKKRKKDRFSLWSRTDVHFFFNLLAWITLFAIPIFWFSICQTEWVGNTHSYTGLFFSYRCLHPGSGISPVVPLLLLLLSWYLWACIQTRRLRFTNKNRPRLPARVRLDGVQRLYVSDDSLSACGSPLASCLYRSITCLLVTRDMLHRFWTTRKRLIDIVLIVIYILLFAVFVFVLPVKSMDRILLSPHAMPTAFEFLVTALFFPLIMISITSWLRMILIWGSLKRSLLERLENFPIRNAFTRLHAVGWMTMLRQDGLKEYWRDAARSNESMRQIVHNAELLKCCDWQTNEQQLLAKERLRAIHQNLDDNIQALMIHIKRETATPADPVQEAHQAENKSGEECGSCGDLDRMRAIEGNYASFSEELLSTILIPYWTKRRSGLVESHDSCPEQNSESRDSKDSDSAYGDPCCIRIAEEFLAIRYVTLIRAVLVNLRYLMTFISAAFVLAILAWNSYPFQPREWVDAIFTTLLAALGGGIIWVMVQMHRNPILNRITETAANKLGLEFYIRIAAFGAVPLLTWLAYQFPELGGTLFRIIKPGLDVMK
jgi:hypothetical protein